MDNQAVGKGVLQLALAVQNVMEVWLGDADGPGKASFRPFSVPDGEPDVIEDGVT